MPTYSYKCSYCGYAFEKRQRMSEDPIKVCPQCKKEAVRRVINQVGIVFKGSGFYVTDNRSGSKTRRNGGSDSTTKKSEGDSAEKSSTKKDKPASSAGKSKSNS